VRFISLSYTFQVFVLILSSIFERVLSWPKKKQKSVGDTEEVSAKFVYFVLYCQSILMLLFTVSAGKQSFCRIS
jgi:cytochrome b561